MRYAVVIEQAGNNYSAYVPDLPGCVATGATKAEVELLIHDAIKLHLAGMREDGDVFPLPSSQVEYIRGGSVAADPVRVDWKHLHEFRLEPGKVTTPTLLLQGVGDGYVQPEAVARLFTGLATPDRSWMVLPDSDHAAHVEDAMPAWVYAIVHFIERPRPGLTSPHSSTADEHQHRE